MKGWRHPLLPLLRLSSPIKEEERNASLALALVPTRSVIQRPPRTYLRPQERLAFLRRRRNTRFLLRLPTDPVSSIHFAISELKLIFQYRSRPSSASQAGTSMTIGSSTGQSLGATPSNAFETPSISSSCFSIPDTPLTSSSLSSVPSKGKGKGKGKQSAASLLEVDDENDDGMDEEVLPPPTRSLLWTEAPVSTTNSTSSTSTSGGGGGKKTKNFPPGKNLLQPSAANFFAPSSSKLAPSLASTSTSVSTASSSSTLASTKAASKAKVELTAVGFLLPQFSQLH